MGGQHSGAFKPILNDCFESFKHGSSEKLPGGSNIGATERQVSENDITKMFPINEICGSHTDGP
jgi:hypothetical protein